jgi:hypothetical protein
MHCMPNIACKHLSSLRLRLLTFGQFKGGSSVLSFDTVMYEVVGVRRLPSRLAQVVDRQSSLMTNCVKILLQVSDLNRCFFTRDLSCCVPGASSLIGPTHRRRGRVVGTNTFFDRMNELCASEVALKPSNRKPGLWKEAFWVVPRLLLCPFKFTSLTGLTRAQPGDYLINGSTASIPGEIYSDHSCIYRSLFRARAMFDECHHVTTRN